MTRRRMIVRNERTPFTDEENAALRSVVQQLVEERGTQTEVAQILGLSQGYISAFLKGKHGFGHGAARKLANQLHTSVNALVGRDTNPEFAAVSDVSPNRARAIAAARWVGVDEKVLHLVARQPVSPERDLSPLQWLRRVLRVLEDVEDAKVIPLLPPPRSK